MPGSGRGGGSGKGPPGLCACSHKPPVFVTRTPKKPQLRFVVGVRSGKSVEYANSRLMPIERSGLLGPLVTVGAAVAALAFLHVGADTALVVDPEGFGPVTWPRIMLYGVVASGVLWGVSRWREARRAKATGQADRAGESEPADPLRLGAGVLAIVGYGAAMVYIGFAFATLLFLAGWFALGGVRRPLPLLANSVLGTLALLYLFLSVAYLPLPRGTGYMDTLTVGLYRALGIF